MIVGEKDFGVPIMKIYDCNSLQVRRSEKERGKYLTLQKPLIQSLLIITMKPSNSNCGGGIGGEVMKLS